jgi:hypothetical protein
LDTNTGRGLVEIVSLYTQTFLWLQRYDEGLLKEPPGQNGGILLTPDVVNNFYPHFQSNLETIIE